MASFSLSNTKRDLWEKVKKQKQHMKHVDYLSKQNIWKSSMHELAYKSHNKNISSSIPSGITKTGLSPRWSTPHKKYESPDARHIHRSVHGSPVTKITTKKKDQKFLVLYCPLLSILATYPQKTPCVHFSQCVH